MTAGGIAPRGPNGMDRDHIRREVARLAPWYYAYDLQGVRTDPLPACDHLGHRTVSLPPRAREVLAGRTVLDVACNEGGYSFQAVESGAKAVHGFDCRPINVEKARFVAAVRRCDNATFEVGDADAWPTSPSARPFDVVFLCGLLYHLQDPPRAIDAYCRIAREAIFVTCMLAGGEDGYTQILEHENIAASRGALPSLMPNTARTLIAEFARHGFQTLYVGENRSSAEYWGGCTLAFQNARAAVPLLQRSGESVHLAIVPRQRSPGRFRFDLVLYNWRNEELALEGSSLVTDLAGRELRRDGPAPIRLARRLDGADTPWSESTALPIDLSFAEQAQAPIEVEIRLRDARTKVECARIRARC